MKGEIVEELKAYFRKRDDVAMAFLFGSRAKEKRIHAGSDWDLAVYFTSGTKQNRGKEPGDGYFQKRKSVWSDCADIIGADNIDIVVLNTAAATLVDAALRGIPLVVKDRGLWLAVMLRVTSEAIDFRDFAKSYTDIFARSASLSEQDAYALSRRMMFVENEMQILKNLRAITLEEYRSDLPKQSTIERSIEKTINAVIDISKIVLASSRKPIPEKYSTIIEDVGLLKPFSLGNTKRIAQWVGLRNFLAHEYLDYRWQEIDDFLKNAPPFLEEFLRAARGFLKKNETR